ncbi:1-deoxy-D-xylulose 5-phosphate reductoisomerase [Branchiibius hedensis]|uniref:1-deoxy-D-xylulose 5-phosphate reductoisomerase n=1 Tax=Branchiibius hedensis TaxID=672460 RepID=A0A2Y9BTU5_9MICO|nr:1-deoxy-D-xylulose-5-phosphate reductoisomerase [Branchiibius hedensis]PWJ25809.1 1-deoxy-D-xylulose 5-phosphate reductoisomerase [Branchiibius hedensis]SSA34622.1 1-deoxy-D-xylulose 5-phosphate reductoisomerase [Branchiibius hedensis]
MSSAASETQRTVALLGSTGSIGTQAVQIVTANPDRFRVVAISAGGRDLDLVARQAVQLQAERVGIASGQERDLATRIGELAREAGRSAYLPQIVTGPDASVAVAQSGADVVLNGITGSIGLRPTLAALQAGSTLALANKESLIVGGPLVKERVKPGQLVPVDSEHSAIAQCLLAGTKPEVRRLVVTASGGPFRGWSPERLKAVTPAQALAHPNFAMGKVITTNSATLVNKGLEVIEAHLLFDVPFEQIEVVVHPQQYIHSMVEFVDGSTVAQCGPPSMLVPISLGLDWPHRVPDAEAPIDWTQARSWEFEPLDNEAFPAVALARQVGEAGRTFPAVYNAANEECVEAFHAGRIAFTDIVPTVQRVVDEHTPDTQLDLDTVLAAEDWARIRTHELLKD